VTQMDARTAAKDAATLATKVEVTA